MELGPAYGYGPIKGRTSRGEMDLPQVNHFAAEMDDFAECIQTGTPSPVPGEEGLRDARILAAIYASIRQGSRTVKL